MAWGAWAMAGRLGASQHSRASAQNRVQRDGDRVLPESVARRPRSSPVTFTPAAGCTTARQAGDRPRHSHRTPGPRPHLNWPGVRSPSADTPQGSLFLVEHRGGNNSPPTERGTHHRGPPVPPARPLHSAGANPRLARRVWRRTHPGSQSPVHSTFPPATGSTPATGGMLDGGRSCPGFAQKVARVAATNLADVKNRTRATGWGPSVDLGRAFGSGAGGSAARRGPSRGSTDNWRREAGVNPAGEHLACPDAFRRGARWRSGPGLVRSSTTASGGGWARRDRGL